MKSENKLSRRYGIVKIGSKFLAEHSDEVLESFRKTGFLPLRVEHDLFRDVVTYAGLCLEFRCLEEGEAAPRYLMLSKVGENGEVTETWMEEDKETPWP